MRNNLNPVKWLDLVPRPSLASRMLRFWNARTMRGLTSPSIDRGWRSIFTLLAAFTSLFAFFFNYYSFAVLYNHLIVVYRQIDHNQTAEASANSSSWVEPGLCSHDDNLGGITGDVMYLNYSLTGTPIV